MTDYTARRFSLRSIWGNKRASLLLGDDFISMLDSI
jgi:hypothetical protein